MTFKTNAAAMTCLASLMAGSASAADFSTPYPALEPSYDEPAAFKWDGAYAGVHGGVASARANPFSGGKSLEGGVQAGYNFQAGPAILGIELEGSYLGKNELKVPGGKVEERYRGAAKARAGVSFDRTLAFGTAGMTMTKFEGGRGVSTADGWKQGYLLGGGIEQGFGGGLSAKFEYNHVTTNGVKTTTSAGTSKSDLTSHVFKAGLNYRF